MAMHESVLRTAIVSNMNGSTIDGCNYNYTRTAAEEVPPPPIALTIVAGQLENLAGRMVDDDSEHGRRRFLGRIIAAVQGTIAATVGVILGGAAISPAFRRRDETWLPAAALGELPIGVPTPVVVGVSRRDGYMQIVDQRTIFPVRTDTSAVRALDSTCTHLGCRVSWDGERQELRCPCHGGAYDRTGAVTAGPPPAPLASIDTRLDGAQVLVRL